MNPVRLMLVALVAALICAAPCSLHAGGSYQARTLLLKNKEYGEALLQGIREARTSITGSFFLFKIAGSRGSQPRRIAEELALAAQRGVAVTVILERERDPRPKDRLSEENRRTADFLSREGVKVLFDSPSVVTHVKVAVIDGRYVFIGSHNLTQSALRHNNELSVRIDSPELAAEVSAYLDRL
jgi:phosphatidylserine/phosphatidylglycerophosphate/cardiolipin synthase-like enzyme